MITRKEAIEYGLSFPNTYVDAPFRDPNWQLIRVKESKKVFLWIYEKDGFVQLTTLIISKKPGNTGISRDIRTEFTTDLLLSD